MNKSIVFFMPLKGKCTGRYILDTMQTLSSTNMDNW